MKILAFAASTSSSSINKKLITWAAAHLGASNDTFEIEVVELNDYELPLFSVDVEKKLGQPQAAQQFLTKIREAEGLVISFAEHNGTYTAAYKNIFDWCSRIEAKVFQDKKMVLLATSPGKRGGQSVLTQAVASAPHFGGVVLASVAVPLFAEVFDASSGSFLDSPLKESVIKALRTLEPA